MHKITLTIEDKTKLDELIEYLKNLEFVEIDSVFDEEDINQKLFVSEEAIKYGKTISQTELEKDIHSWRKK